jgi:hypothetical protein
MQLQYRIFTVLFISVLCLTWLSLFAVAGTYKLQHEPKALDFLALYTGAQLMSQSPNELYNLHAQMRLQQQIDPLTKDTIFLPFINPPFVALLFQLIVKFGFENAYLILLGINALLLSLIGYIAIRHMGNTTKKYSLLLIIGLITFIPILLTLLIGQLSIILCAILLLSWIFLRNGWEFRGGLLLALLLIKPHFLIVPFLAVLVQRRKKIFLGLVAGIAILLGISYISVGWEGINNYIMLLDSFYKTGVGYNIDLMEQYSLQTLLLIVFHTQSLAAIRVPWLLSIIAIIIPTLYLWSKKFPMTSSQFSLQFALLIIATLLTSPHTPLYDLSLLIVVAIILLSRRTKTQHRQKTRLLIFIILGYIISLVGYRWDILSHDYTQTPWICVTVVYLIAFWIVILKELFRGFENGTTKNSLR